MQIFGSTDLLVQEHDGKVTVVRHSFRALTYKIDTEKVIYEIEGDIHFISNEKGCFIEKLDAEDNATEGKLIRYEVSADPINELER